MGQYDAVAKVEFPDDSTAAAFTLAIAASGRQRTETLRAFSEADLKRIVAQIP